MLRLALPTALALAALQAAQAQPVSPNQPRAIQYTGITPPPCPLIVPAREFATQPLRIAPAAVAAKNAVGCLSPADAVYGADGCPVRLCSASAGTVPMPSSP